MSYAACSQNTGSDNSNVSSSYLMQNDGQKSTNGLQQDRLQLGQKQIDTITDMLSSDNCALDQAPMFSEKNGNNGRGGSYLKQQIVSVTKENDKLNIDVNVKQNEITKLNFQLKNIETNLKNIGCKVKQDGLTLVDTSKDYLNEFEKFLDERQKEESLQKKSFQTDLEVNSMKKIRDTLTIKQNQLNETYDQKKQQHYCDVEKFKKKIRCVKEKVCELEEKVCQIRNQILDNIKCREQIARELQRLCECIKAEKERAECLKQAKARLREQICCVENAIEDTKRNIEDLKKNMQSNIDALQDMKQRIAELTRLAGEYCKRKKCLDQEQEQQAENLEQTEARVESMNQEIEGKDQVEKQKQEKEEINAQIKEEEEKSKNLECKITEHEKTLTSLRLALRNLEKEIVQKAKQNC